MADGRIVLARHLVGNRPGAEEAPAALSPLTVHEHANGFRYDLANLLNKRRNGRVLLLQHDVEQQLFIGRIRERFDGSDRRRYASSKAPARRLSVFSTRGELDRANVSRR